MSDVDHRSHYACTPTQLQAEHSRQERASELALSAEVRQREEAAKERERELEEAAR